MMEEGERKKRKRNSVQNTRDTHTFHVESSSARRVREIEEHTHISLSCERFERRKINVLASVMKGQTSLSFFFTNNTQTQQPHNSCSPAQKRESIYQTR